MLGKLADNFVPSTVDLLSCYGTTVAEAAAVQEIIDSQSGVTSTEQIQIL